MLCRKPFMIGAVSFGCGQCHCCRVNKKRQWAHRIMLESLKHPEASFVTLTYSDEFLPENGSLVKKDAQLFMKRMRRLVEPNRLRYFLVGEYGDETERPHYHAALFGRGSENQDLVEKAWNKGHCMVGTLTKDSAQYVAGYVVKKLTNKNDPYVINKLRGRHPEFATMSLKPGIGAHAMEDIAKQLTTPIGKEEIDRSDDVPFALSHGRGKWPLGRYLRQKLREKVEEYDEDKYFKNEEVKKKSFEKYSQEMCELLREDYTKEENKNKSLTQLVVDSNMQSILNKEKRAKIFKKRSSL